MPELKPCPFCGGEALVSEFIGHGFRSYPVGCKERKTLMKYVDSKEAAIQAWNTRAYEEKNDANV